MGTRPKGLSSHVHFVVPGGGISDDGSRWLQVKPDWLFHWRPARQLYKEFFVEELRTAGLYDQLPAGVLKFDWVVNIKPVGGGGAVLKYLAPYVYRIAICDNRIESVDDTGVRYKVKPSGADHYQCRHLDGESFVRCFAQHILPPGFKKIRYYGFMSSNCKLQFADARWLVYLWLGWTLCLSQLLVKPEIPPRRPPKCERCHSQLKLIGVTNSDGNWLWRSLATPRGPPTEPLTPARRELLPS